MAEGQPPPQQQQYDSKKWPVVYPAYIDAAKTIALVRSRCPPAHIPPLCSHRSLPCGLCAAAAAGTRACALLAARSAMG